MSKSFLASVAAFLIWTSATLAQGKDVPAAPTPVKVPDPPMFQNLWEGPMTSVCGDMGLTSGGILGGGVFTADAEYVLWFLSTRRFASPAVSTDTLGRPTAVILGDLGDVERDQALKTHSGARFAFGYWQVTDNYWVPGGIRDLGAESVFFFVGQRSRNFATDIPPILVRPFFDLNNRQESAFVVAAPGLATGGIAAHGESRLWGAELNVWKNAYFNYPGTCFSVNLMAGFRYLDMEQELDVSSFSTFNRDLTPFPAFLPFAGNTLQVSDSFATRNQFYGGQIGVAGKFWIFGEMAIDATMKLALGNNSENLDIAGSQLRTLANSTVVASPAGFLALRTNSGSHHINRFAQIPEATVKVSYPVMEHLTLTGGFSALYWSQILRPGLQIDRSIDITQIPNFPPATSAVPTGLAAPGVPFRQSDLWLLGITFGLEVNW